MPIEALYCPNIEELNDILLVKNSYDDL